MTHASHKAIVRRTIVVLVSLSILISFIISWDDLKEGWNTNASKSTATISLGN